MVPLLNVPVRGELASYPYRTSSFRRVLDPKIGPGIISEESVQWLSHDLKSAAYVDYYLSEINNGRDSMALVGV